MKKITFIGKGVKQLNIQTHVIKVSEKMDWSAAPLMKFNIEYQKRKFAI